MQRASIAVWMLPVTALLLWGATLWLGMFEPPPQEDTGTTEFHVRIVPAPPYTVPLCEHFAQIVDGSLHSATCPPLPRPERPHPRRIDVR